MRTIRLLAISFAVTALGTAPAAAASCTATWDDDARDRRWSSTLNWSADALPGAGDRVCIPALAGGPVVVDVPVTVVAVAASHPVLVDSGRSLSAVLDGGTYTLADSAALAGGRIAGATVLVGVGDRATLAGGEMAAGTLGGGGEARITGSYVWSGGRMLGDGVTSVAPGAVVTIDADLPNGSPQRYNASIEDDRHLQNSGTIVWAKGYVGINDQATMHNAGTLSLQSSTDSWEANTGTGAAALVNTGLIERPAGTNRISLPSIDNDGTIRATRGTLDFDTLLQTADGRIELELGGTTQGTDHGGVSSFFSTRVSGTLAVTLSPAYSPDVGDVFRVVGGRGFSGGRKGTFSALELPGLPDGRSLTATYDAQGVDLTVTSAPGGDARAAHAGTAHPSPVEAWAPAPATLAPLQAVDDVYRRPAARRLFLGGRRGPRANDRFPPGTSLRLVSRPRRARVHLDHRTGALRILRRSRAAGVLRLQYRLVAPDGRRSRAATVTIRLS